MSSHSNRRVPGTRRVVLLTDAAYERLARLAVKHEYVRPPKDPYAVRYEGMSAFIEAIQFGQLKDTRPDNIRRIHDQQIASCIAPSWRGLDYGLFPENPPRQRKFRATQETIDGYIRIAVEFGIVGKYAWGGPRRNWTGTAQPRYEPGPIAQQRPYARSIIRHNEMSIVTSVLEAIGIGYLTVVDIPHPSSLNVERIARELEGAEL